MKTKMIAMVFLLPALAISNSVSATDFDCTSVDKDTLVQVMEKNNAGETLTTTEQTLLENAKACGPEGRVSNGGQNGEKPELTDAQMAEREAMDTILEKQKNGETLTTAEQTQLDNFTAKQGGVENMKKDTTTNTSEKVTTSVKVKTSSSLSNAYKTKIDTAFKAIVLKMSSDSDATKITTLQTLNTRLDTLNTTIENSTTYSDANKVTLSLIIDYLSTKIEAQIKVLSSDDVITDIFDTILD